MEISRPKTTETSSSTNAFRSSSSTDVFRSSKRVASLIQQSDENHMVRRNDCNSVYQPPPTTQRTGRSDKEEWVLPTDRKEYIRTHDATKLAKLHTLKENNIPPLWTKITKTPFTDKAKLCTGYGVAMERTKISEDAPNYFLDPHSQYGVKHPHSDHHPRFARLAFTGSKGSNRNEPNESAYVLPGGKSILEANMKSRENFSRSNYRKFFHGTQAYIDHLATPKSTPPIAWER